MDGFAEKGVCACAGEKAGLRVADWIHVACLEVSLRFSIGLTGLGDERLFRVLLRVCVTCLFHSMHFAFGLRFSAHRLFVPRLAVLCIMGYHRLSFNLGQGTAGVLLLWPSRRRRA